MNQYYSIGVVLAVGVIGGLGLERKAEVKFTELNDAMREYHEVFGHELPPLPQEPVRSDYYTPNDEQHHWDS